MYTVFILDFLSALILTAALTIIWQERMHFYSLRPFLPAIFFLVISRICNIFVEHPNIRLSNYFHAPPGSVELKLSIAGNVFDNISFLFIVYGFIKVINYKKADKKRIQSLEQLLPLCSNCKKYRTEDGQWLPIERYLIDSHAPAITHGICPECSEKLYSHLMKK